MPINPVRPRICPKCGSAANTMTTEGLVKCTPCGFTGIIRRFRKGGPKPKNKFPERSLETRVTIGNGSFWKRPIRY